MTKTNDAIDLVFGDGNFSNLPLGTFRLYYRKSDNAKYIIQPTDMQGIQVTVPYTDANGADQSISLTLCLKASVYNSAATESND